MINQKKCRNCGKWTDGSLTRCVFCDATIDPALLAVENKKARDKAAHEKRILEENRFERYLRKLQESDKPIHKLSFKILHVIFTIYMGVLSFFIWLIALISG